MMRALTNTSRENSIVTMGARTVVFLLVGATLVFGQTLDHRIPYPDSFGILGIATRTACDTVNGKVYVAGIGTVGVLAGPEGHRSGRIDIAGNTNFTNIGLYWHPTLGKVYNVPGYDTLVTVIDTETDSVVATMSLPSNHSTIDGYVSADLDARNNKLYVLVRGGCAVFDLTADTLLRIIFGEFGLLVCCNPLENKWYNVAHNRVDIYDGDTDSLLASVPAGNGASDIIYLEKCNKVYVSNLFGSSVTIVDGSGDSVICQLSTPEFPVTPIVNETDGKVYVPVLAGDDSYVIIDGYGDSVRTVIPFSGGGVCGAAWNSRSNKVYLSYKGGYKVVDGATDSVLSDVGAPTNAFGGISNPVENITYLYNREESRLLAIDGAADTVMWHEVTGRWVAPRAAVWSSRFRRLFVGNRVGRDYMVLATDPAARIRTTPVPCSTATWLIPPVLSHDDEKLYGGDYDDFEMFVMSCSTASVTDTLSLHGGVLRALWSIPSLRRVYRSVNVRDTSPSMWRLDIIDTDTDTVVNSIYCHGNSVHVEQNVAAYSETTGKLYWPSYEYLLVIDALGDSLLRTVQVAEDGAHITSVVWRASGDQVYAAVTGSDSPRFRVIDCATDSVVATIATGRDEVMSMCYSPSVDRIYAQKRGHGNLFVIDCGTNQVVKNFYIACGDEFAPVFNPVGNKVFLAVTDHGGSSLIPLSWQVVAVDCGSDEIVARLDVGFEPLSLTVDPDSGIVMATCLNSVLCVIRDQSPGGLVASERALPARTTFRVRPNPSSTGFFVYAELQQHTRVHVGVYDSAGRMVRLLGDGAAGPGRLSLHWDGADSSGPVVAGTYFIRLVADGRNLTRKVVIQK